MICLNGIKIRGGAYIESSQFIPEEKEGQQTPWHLQTNTSVPTISSKQHSFHLRAVSHRR